MRALVVALLLLVMPHVAADDGADDGTPSDPPATDGGSPDGNETAPEPTGPSEEPDGAVPPPQDGGGYPAPVFPAQDPETGANGVYVGGSPSGTPPTWSGGTVYPIGVDHLPCPPVGIVCPWA